MRIRVATSIAEVEALRPLWQEALRRSASTIFQDFNWNLLALRTFSDESPTCVAAEDDSSIAILPMVRHNGALSFAGGPLFDYRDAICGGDSSALDAALGIAASFELPLTFAGLRGAKAAERWSRLVPQPWTAAPFVSSEHVTAETFAAKHARGRRALRRLAELGAQLRRLQATPAAIERIYREKGKEPAGWGTNVFRDERCVQFMRIVVAAPHTRSEILLLEMTQRPIAALVTFLDQGTRRFYTTWMDAAWSRHSPGVALLFEATRLTLEEGLNCDYMTGEQGYKMRFATGSEPLYKIDAGFEQLSALKHELRDPVEPKAV